MINKPQMKMVAIFSFTVFVIVTISMFIMGTFAGFLYHLGLLNRPRPLVLIICLGLFSVIVSTTFAHIIGKKVLAPVSKLNEATKEVAKGNFEIRLTEESRALEIIEMAHNFNIMTQELGNTETFRNDFINNVSHEFKTPISAIEGYATLLQDKNLSEEERDEYIAKILKNTKRLSSLSGNILQISRLENQEIVPTKKSYLLDEQLRQSVLLFESEWTKKNMELDIDLESVTFCGSKDLLAQVWQNIFGNAVKFAPQNGTIGVRLRQNKDSAIVSISDNGIGMSDQVRKRVFEKFYQGDNSHSSEGNGLGLTLVKRIVDLCDGTIEIVSQEGKGTTFTVKLPIGDNV